MARPSETRKASGKMGRARERDGAFDAIAQLRIKIEEIKKRQQFKEGEDSAEENADAENLEGTEESSTPEDRRQDEKDKVRGFDDGGNSVESSVEEDLLKQLEFMEQEIDERHKKLGILDILDQLEEDIVRAQEQGALAPEHDEEGRMSMLFPNIDDALKFATQHVERIKALGFDASFTATSNSKVVVTVQMPEKFKGRDPLDMSGSEIMEAREQAENERSSRRGQPEASKEKGVLEKPVTPGIWERRVKGQENESQNSEVDRKPVGRWTQMLVDRNGKGASRGVGSDGIAMG